MWTNDNSGKSIWYNFWITPVTKNKFGYILFKEGDEYLGQILKEKKEGFGIYKFNSDNNNEVYRIHNNVISSLAIGYSMPRMVINISENTTVTGEGTEDDPYVVTGMSSEIRKTN